MKSRLPRKNVVSTGAILFFILLYTVFILHHTYGNHNPNDSKSSEVSTTGPGPTLLPDKSKHTTHADSGADTSPVEPVKSVTIIPPLAQNTLIPGTWIFNTTRDEKAYSLTEERCDSAFPALFTEIERAVEYRKKVGIITQEDVDISWKDVEAVRAMIIDQQVR